MATEETSKSKRKGVIVCQDGELDLQDPAIEDGFADLKAAIMTGRTDILRVILSAAQTYREEEEMFDEDEQEEGAKRLTADDEEVLDLLQMLLNFRDNDAGTGLHYATKLDRADMVRSLLAAGANPTLRNFENATPYDYCKSDAMKNAYTGALMQAVAQSKPYRVELLLQAGVDVNSGDGAESDNKVLHWAASFANLNTVQLILESGADVNAVNGDGSTALHDAIVRGDQDIFLELLKYGARVNIIPFKGPLEGKSCYDLAAGKEDILTLLEVHLLTADSHVNGKQRDEDETKDEVSSIASKSSIQSSTSSAVPLAPLEDKPQIKLLSPDASHTPTKAKDPSQMHTPSENQFKPILLPPTSPMRLFFPTIVKLDPGVSQLWPPPKKILQYKGTSYVPPLTLNVILMTSGCTSTSQISEFSTLMRVMQPKFQSSGFNIQTEISSSHSSSPACSKGSVECYIDSSTLCHDEEYRLQISTRKVKIVAGCMKSIYYALNTFLQCLRIFQGKGLPLLQITDVPEMKIRGVQFDFVKGDLPKIENLLHFIDILSGFKINQVHLPVHLFLPDDHKRCINYTRSDLLHLHQFCQDRYVDLIPALRFSDVLDDINALSFSFMKSDILPLFPCSRFLSVSLVDIENPSKSKRNLLSGITDNELVRRIEDLHEFCIGNGLTLLIDLEIILQQPFKLLEINHNLICLNLSQDTTSELGCEHLADLGVSHIVSPSYKDDHTLIKDVRSCLRCFANSEQIGRRNGSLGMICRVESQSSSLCCCTIDLASLAVGAAMSWRSSPSVTVDEAMLLAIINRHVYQDDNDVIGKTMLKLSSLEVATVLQKTQSEMQSPNQESSSHVEECQYGQLKSLLNVTDDLSSRCLSLETLKSVSISLRQLEGSIGKCKIKCDLKEMVIAELSSIIRILSFVCRIGIALHKPKKNDSEEVKLSELTQIQRSDLSNKLMSLLEQYESYCSTYYKETPQGLKSVEILSRLLSKLHPEQQNSFFNALARTFTV